MKIIENNENSLLNRREIKFIAEAEKNPSFDEALNLASEHFKADRENIIIRQIKGKFGRNTFLITAFIYKSKEDKEKIERKKKKTGQATEQSQEQAVQKS